MIKLWAGSEESFDLVVRAETLVAEGIKAGRFSGSADDGLPPLWNKQGDTGVVNIQGSLVDGDSGWMRFFGVVGYDNIAKAAIAAATDPDVKTLMFNFATPGGEVNGMYETAALLKQISEMKPSLAYTGTMMASAGYALGTAITGGIHSSAIAEVGSIGVLKLTKEYSKQLERDGVTVKVMRSGDMKARINPYEAMTPEAEAHLQSQLNDHHDMFRGHVAKNRPGLTAEDLAQATDGRTFLGKRAVSAGLVDKISTFEQALKLLDKNSGKKDTSSNSKGGKQMNIVLTAQQMAAIQAGATPLSLGLVLDGTPEQQAAALAAATVAGAPESAQAAADAAAATAAAAAADKDKANPPTAPPVISADSNMLALVQAQLTLANAELITTKAELINLKASTQTQTASHDGLLKIARTSIAKMDIGLGGSGASAASLDASAAIVEYERISASFLAKYKPGQQSAATPIESKKAGIDPAFLHAAKNAPTPR